MKTQKLIPYTKSSPESRDAYFTYRHQDNMARTSSFIAGWNAAMNADKLERGRIADILAAVEYFSAMTPNRLREFLYVHGGYQTRLAVRKHFLGKSGFGKLLAEVIWLWVDGKIEIKK